MKKELKRSKLSSNLIALRESKGYSQRELATLAKIAQCRIANYELGKNVPCIGSLLELSVALDCSLGDLLKGVGDGYGK